MTRAAALAFSLLLAGAAPGGVPDDAGARNGAATADGGAPGAADGGARDSDAEVIEDLDLLERLELLEHLELLDPGTTSR